MEKLQDCLERLFGIDGNTSATIIITLLVFISGYLMNAFVSYLEKRSQRARYRRMFKTFTLEISKSCEKQVEKLQKAIHSCSINDITRFRLTIININHLDNIEKLEMESVYNAFFGGIENLFKNRKERLFNTIWKNISVLLHNNKIILGDYSEFVENINEQQQLRNEALGEFQKKIENYMIDHHKQKVDKHTYMFVKGVDTIMYEWQAMENNAHYYVSNNGLVNPLIDYFREQVKNGHPISLEFLNPLLKASFHYQSMEYLITIQHQKLEELCFSYQKNAKMIRICAIKL